MTTMLKRLALAAGLLCTLNPQLSTALAQGTAFTYQGRLNQNGAPYTGSAEFQASLWSVPTGGVAVASNVTGSVVVGVTNGLFVLPLDFGANFPGADRWLELDVRTNLLGFTTLTPRQPLAATPYAIAAGTLTGALPASQLSGSLTLAQLPSGVVTNGASNLNLSGSFAGNAGGLTNVTVNSLVLTTTNTTIRAWGPDNFGQTTVPSGLNNVAAVAAGGEAYSLALKTDGTVVAWGNNFWGQTNVPTGLNHVVAVAAGRAHNLALRTDGTVVAWGNNYSGQTNVPPGLNSVAAIAAGESHSLALKMDGTVVAWGDNSAGQTNVPAGLNNVAAIAVGRAHSLALKSNGAVIAWGANEAGQTNIPAGLSNVVALAAGSYHNLALKTDGTVVAWGWNSHGQTNVPAGLGNVVAVAAGWSHSLVLKTDGTVVAWGDNSFGQGTVPPGLNSVVALGPGSTAYHVLVLRKQAFSPVAWLDTDNTFNGKIQFNDMITGKVGINTLPQQVLHLYAPSGMGEGMQIDSAAGGHAPAIYLNHTGAQGRTFRIASYGDNTSPGSFRIRDETAGADRLTIDATGVLSGNGSGLTGVALRAGGNVFTGNQTVTGGSVGIGTDTPSGRLTVQTTDDSTPSVVSAYDTRHVVVGTPSAGLALSYSPLNGSAYISALDPNVAWKDLAIQANTLSFRPSGGVASLVVSNNGSIYLGSQTRQMLNLYGTGYGIGIQDFTMYFRTDPTGGFSWFKGGVHSDSQNNPGSGGTEMMRLDAVGGLNVRGAVTANSLILTSDRAAKENFKTVDVRTVLDKVAALPVSEWSFKTEPGTRHIGPMAQDFYASFHTGSDDQHIAVVDEGGVALAAIQGLNQKLQLKETEISELKIKNQSLERRLEALEQIVLYQKPK